MKRYSRFKKTVNLKILKITIEAEYDALTNKTKVYAVISLNREYFDYKVADKMTFNARFWKDSGFEYAGTYAVGYREVIDGRFPKNNEEFDNFVKWLVNHFFEYAIKG